MLTPSIWSGAKSSSTCCLQSVGRITSRTPARFAARNFSLIPPTGSTLPLSVISPVIAVRGCTGVSVSKLTRAVAMVTPAEGPSFGIAPAGTWICRSVSFNRSSSSPSEAAFDRTHVSAACMLSFITSPIWPVMKESMQAALTWVRSNAASLGLDEDLLKDTDLHIHVPAGAIPKDGPSAGVTMATALVSLLTDTPVHPLTAMTGEITLSGNVLPVGGIKEKFLAAKRAGVRDVVLPTDCKQQVDEDLTPEQIEGVTIHYANRIEDVLAVALPKTPREVVQDEVVREEVIHAGV